MSSAPLQDIGHTFQLRYENGSNGAAPSVFRRRVEGSSGMQIDDMWERA
jgi:hypothetical protein